MVIFALMHAVAAQTDAMDKNKVPGILPSGFGVAVDRDIEKIREFRTDVFLNAKKQIAVEAYIVDDRGQQHFSKVFL